MTHRSLKSQTLVRVAIVFGILVLLNIVSVRLFGRLDLTKNHLFTLSDASKQLMRSLDDKVTVKAYFTEDLPSPYNNNRRELLDELNEYKAYSRGNLLYDFIDPSGEKGEQEAQQQGISPVQVQVVKEDKFEVKRAYMGVVLLYEDRKEVLPVIQNTASLEYDLSSTIKRLTNRTQKKIGFLTGHGEPPLSELSHAQEILRKQYDVQTVDVSKNAQIPADISALLVMAPTSRIPEPDKFQIDQYIMRGGRVAFLLNKVDANLQNRFGRALDVNLDDMLDAYGLRENADLVRDVQCASVSVVQQQYGFSIQSQVPFPFLPLASNFSKGNAMVKDLQGIVLFFVSSVDTVNNARRNLHGEILIRSSKQSGRQTGYFLFDPLQRYTREDLTSQFGESGIPLAAVVEGRMKSLYTGKPVPSDTAAGSATPTSSPLTESPDTRVVLVGDGDFARDQYLGNRDNLTFFANMVDYLVDDAGLITIRSKEVSMPPLEQVSDGTKKILKYANLVFPPLLVVAYGLARWRMRKARKRALELH
jgi:gliding-associated putative ABC transporter substrate-binding component GldG